MNESKEIHGRMVVQISVMVCWAENGTSCSWNMLQREFMVWDNKKDPWNMYAPFGTSPSKIMSNKIVKYSSPSVSNGVMPSN